MKHVVTINKANLKTSAEKGGHGQMHKLCQSACKLPARSRIRSASPLNNADIHGRDSRPFILVAML